MGQFIIKVYLCVTSMLNNLILILKDLWDILKILWDMVIIFLNYTVFIIFSIAFFTLMERKFMSSIQRRKGPNTTGMFGLLQPIADALKLLLKESTYPSNSYILIFFLAPIFTFMCSLFIWFFIPFKNGAVIIELPYSIFFLFALSSLTVHGIMFSGWSSNSKYAFLGSIRSASQMLSYEIALSSVYISVIMASGSMSIHGIVKLQSMGVWFVLPLFPFWVLFVICSLAETNRTPFDLPEAEAELVAGYNVEYSAISFALFFLAEYGNMLSISCISTILFFGGWSSPFLFINPFFAFTLKVCFNLSFFLWVRACVPRYRYDHLMKIGWKRVLPICFSLLMLESALLLLITTV